MHAAPPQPLPASDPAHLRRLCRLTRCRCGTGTRTTLSSSRERTASSQVPACLPSLPASQACQACQACLPACLRACLSACLLPCTPARQRCMLHVVLWETWRAASSSDGALSPTCPLLRARLQAATAAGFRSSAGACPSSTAARRKRSGTVPQVRVWERGSSGGGARSSSGSSSSGTTSASHPGGLPPPNAQLPQLLPTPCTDLLHRPPLTRMQAWRCRPVTPPLRRMQWW